jgi:hypothetical protein
MDYPRECYGTHDAGSLQGFHLPPTPRHGPRKNSTRMFPIVQDDTLDVFQWNVPREATVEIGMGHVYRSCC